jgi:siroheme decarboxylase
VNNLEQRLLNEYQREFPLVSKPFAKIARELESDCESVLGYLENLQSCGKVSRIGPVFKPNQLGASTLAAMSVPAAQLTEVAQLVSDFPEVNHNYEREHAFNLWFVVVAADRHALQDVLDDIESVSSFEVISLPLVREYHIDLGFNLFPEGESQKVRTAGSESIENESGSDSSLIAAIQTGLPLVERPYAAIAEQLGRSEESVIGKIAELQRTGIIRRFGVVVRHHELGFRANAMVVWDVHDNQVNTIGEKLSAEDKVTLCYQRPRALPRWPYNLFSMVHGKDRQAVMDYVSELAARLGLASIPHELLFSRQRFKQRGARYVASEK